MPVTEWIDQPLPPSDAALYHLYEDGTIMMYEDGTRMLLDSAGVGIWLSQPLPVTTWTEEP